MGDFSTAVCAALDPVLVPAGFLAGQGGGDQVIFCTGVTDLRERFPDLPQGHEQDAGCVDLVLDQHWEAGRHVDLEGHSVPDTLRAVGLADDAVALERALDDGIVPALPVLADVLGRLFSAPAHDAG